MYDWSIPQRQSIKSIFIYVLKGIKGIFFFILYMVYKSQSSESEYAIWFGLGTTLLLIIGSFVSPVLQYLYLKFHIEGDELIIQRGFLNKERKAIPLERIQNINIDQNVVQRFLSIVALEVETAGSKAKELAIPGLERDVATALKNELNKRSRALKSDRAVDATTADSSLDPSLTDPDADPNAQLTEDTGRVIMNLGIADLFRVGITQNHLKSGGAAVGLMIGFYYQFQDMIQDIFGDLIEGYSWENTIASATMGIVVVSLIGFMIASVLVSLVIAINAYWGFKMVQKDDYLEVTMGLLNRKEIKIPLQKVQVLQFHSNPLRKLLGFKTAAIYQAQSDGNGKAGISIPACTPEHRRELHQILFDQPETAPETKYDAHPWSYARLRLYMVGIIAVPAALFFVYMELYWPLLLIVLVWALNVFFAYQYGKNSWIGRDADFISFKKGWLFPTEIITPVFKTQAVERWRSIFLKRRKENHIKIHTAAGSRGLRYLNQSDVESFYNSVNNQVLVDHRKWM